jgi:hypothetical protein
MLEKSQKVYSALHLLACYRPLISPTTSHIDILRPEYCTHILPSTSLALSVSTNPSLYTPTESAEVFQMLEAKSIASAFSLCMRNCNLSHEQTTYSRDDTLAYKLVTKLYQSTVKSPISITHYISKIISN